MPDATSEAVQFWILVATAATGVFTGLSAVIAWLLYRQSRVDTGRANPIAIGQPRNVPNFGRHPWDLLSGQLRSYVLPIRQFGLYVYNRSDIAQTVVLTDLRWLWPRHLGFRFLEARPLLHLPPRDGGNIWLLAFNPAWVGLPDESLETMIRETPEHRGWVRISGETLSGHKLSFLGRIELTDTGWALPHPRT